MSNVYAFCKTRAGATEGKWFFYPGCVGRRSPSIAASQTSGDSRFAPSPGLWAPIGAAYFCCRISNASDSAKRREAAVEEYKNRRGTLFVREDVVAAYPWMVDLRRASSAELRSALLRVKKHWPPAGTSGSEDASGQGSETPSDVTSLLRFSRGAGDHGSRGLHPSKSRAKHEIQVLVG